MRLEALYAVQALVKNNEPLILHAKNLGALPHLMQLLVDPNEDVLVRSRALSTVGSLMDHQTDLQDAFVGAKGLDLMCDVISAARKESNERVQFRAVFTISWLLQNREDLKTLFSKSNSLHTQLRFCAASQNEELKEAAMQMLQLLK